MPKLLRYGAAVLTVAVLVCLVGFVQTRGSGDARVFWMYGLLVCFGIMALAVFEGAYVSEIIRAGILAVDKGQWEAANSLGLSAYKIYRWIVLPQALRIVLPPLATCFSATTRS